MCTPSPVLPRAVLPSFSGHVDSLGHEDRALGGRDNSPGRSGRVYTIEKVLAERENPLLCVYRARSDSEKFIIKDMIPGELEYQQDLRRRVASRPHVRTTVDTIPEFEQLVYAFLAGDLLQFDVTSLSHEVKRSILKQALLGLAQFHDHGIIHTDIKPNNILLDYDDTTPGDLVVHAVQVTDLEDAVLLEPHQNIRGCLCGNPIWRSPESWARAGQNTPSDIFSFGVVCIYIMLNSMVLRATDEELRSDDAWRYVLRRQISFLGDEAGFDGLLSHIGQDNPFFERLIARASNFTPDRPRRPFASFDPVDPEFRDLVVRMTNLDPAKRITAREFLEHPWFSLTAS